MKTKEQSAVTPFTTQDKFVIFILAMTQFTVVLDFMVMSPMGDMLMKSMSLTTSQFGMAVSAYAFSAGISGLLTAGFADKYDRKKLLIFFYTGFIAGTFLCGFADTYFMLMAARIITGLFGGVIGSIGMAIITDIFSMQQRGRVMGFVQMGFGASQVLGIPISLFIANSWGWQAPFIMVAAFSVLVAVLVYVKMPAVDKHLLVKNDKSALLHLWHTMTKKDYRIAFTAVCLLSLGGFMMMPFGSAYAINNLKITMHELPIVFMVSGISTLIIMPLVGKLSDKMDKFKLFAIASVWMIAVVLVYTHLPVTPLWGVIIVNILMMMGIMSRMIPSQTLNSGIPEMKDRGAYMSISSSLAQIAGGIAAAVGGMIVMQKDKYSPLQHYDMLGYVVIGISIVAVIMMYRVSKMVKRKNAEHATGSMTAEEAVAVAEM